MHAEIIRQKRVFDLQNVLDNIVGLQELPFGRCCGRRVEVGQDWVRQTLGLCRNSEQLAQLSLPRRHN